MIKPLLEGFDPDRTPLPFLGRILARCALSETSPAHLAKFGNGIRNLRTLCRWAKTAPYLGRLRGVLSGVYLDAASTMPSFECPRCLKELWRRSPRQRVLPRSETGQRALLGARR